MGTFLLQPRVCWYQLASVRAVRQMSDRWSDATYFVDYRMLVLNFFGLKVEIHFISLLYDFRFHNIFSRASDLSGQTNIEGWYGTTGDITSHILSDRYVRRSHCGIKSHPLFTKVYLIFQRNVNSFGWVRQMWASWSLISIALLMLVGNFLFFKQSDGANHVRLWILRGLFGVRFLEHTSYPAYAVFSTC